MSHRRYPIAGVPFDFLHSAEVLDAILRRPSSSPLTVCMVNPYTVMMCRRSPQVRDAVLTAGLSLPDGAGISLAARLLNFPPPRRIPGPVLVLDLCRDGRASGLRHYFYGGAPGVASAMALRLSQSYPGLQVAGCHSPAFTPTVQDIPAPDRDRINASSADIVWVGLGSPKQEMWVARNAPKLAARAVIAVGAAFDFHAGSVPWAPPWLRAAGLEWLYRLAKEPARLWRRNLDSPLFLAAVLRQRLGSFH